MHLSGLRILEIHSYIHALTNLKFHVGFFNAFLLRFRKVLFKNSLFKCSRRVYYAPFAVLRYISVFVQLSQTTSAYNNLRPNEGKIYYF